MYYQENEVYRSNTPCNELEIINVGDSAYSSSMYWYYICLIYHLQAIREDRFNVDLLNQTDVDNYLDKENEFTALHFAAHFNRHAVVKMLLEELKAGQCYQVTTMIARLTESSSLSD